MSGEALYERYKNALRRGHVASLRGRLDDALAAYAEASRLAPDRATPHVSAGAALLRRRRPAEALRAYESALRITPRDEAALVGRAEALAALGNRGEAAEAFDALAAAREAAGSLGDAVDAERRALALAEGRTRRRTLERLVEELRASESGEPARAALEQALHVLERTIVAPLPDAAARGPVDGETVAGKGIAPAEPEAGGTPGALDRNLPADLDLVTLASGADAALDAGDRDGALGRHLDLAAAHRAAGRADAAIDACYQALSVAPDDVGLHLALVVLYGERGWRTLAGDKLGLLAALTELDGDEEAGARVAAARSVGG